MNLKSGSSVCGIDLTSLIGICGSIYAPLPLLKRDSRIFSDLWSVKWSSDVWLQPNIDFIYAVNMIIICNVISPSVPQYDSDQKHCKNLIYKIAVLASSA